MLSFLRGLTRPLARELQRRRELRELLDKDEWLLRDIGLTRDEVARALRRRQPVHARDHLPLTTLQAPMMQPPC